MQKILQGNSLNDRVSVDGVQRSCNRAVRSNGVSPVIQRSDHSATIFYVVFGITMASSARENRAFAFSFFYSMLCLGCLLGSVLINIVRDVMLDGAVVLGVLWRAGRCGWMGQRQLLCLL